MRIVWLSDTDFRVSGYFNITMNLCKGLVELGHEVTIVGLGYHGEQHDFPFSIIPIQNFQEANACIANLYKFRGFDVLIVALDIPMQEQFLRTLEGRPFKYIGIMPIEADPLCMSWAGVLLEMDKRLIISEFGVAEAAKMGISATYLPVGIDTELWRMPSKEEREALRTSFGFNKDIFAILTVADNQERKNLSKAFEIMGEFVKGKPNVKYVLVTREHCPVGWKLRDMALMFGINNNLMVFERGMGFKELWALYAVSDCFLMTSKAEGLCTLPDAEVWTSSGKIHIQDVSKNDVVITHTGHQQYVSKVFSRQYSGKIQELNVSYGLPKIQLTPGHLVYGAIRTNKGHGNARYSKLEWIPIECLTKGDYVFYPRSIVGGLSTKLDSIKISDYINNVIVENGIAYLSGRNQFGTRFKHPNAKHLPEEFYITKNFLSLLGFYISEGCYTGDGTSFSFHTNEIEYQEEVQKYVKECFDLDMTVYYKERHRCDMRFNSVLAGRLLAELCGYGSHEKHLPEWALWMSEDMTWALIRSMFLGDGSYDKYKQWKMRYSTVSKVLAEQLQFILSRMGIFASFKSQSNRVEYVVTIHRQDLHKVPFINKDEIPKLTKQSSKQIELENGFLLPINSINDFEYAGKVYNLEVETDNSYLLAGGAVHNCMPLMEAQAVGVPCVATSATGMKELLSDNRGLLVNYDYVYIDCFGNGNRYYMNKEDAVLQLDDIYNHPHQRMINKARKYVESRTWDKAVAVLDAEIKDVTKK